MPRNLSNNQILLIFKRSRRHIFRFSIRQHISVVVYRGSIKSILRVPGMSQDILESGGFSYSEGETSYFLFDMNNHLNIRDKYLRGKDT